MCRLGESGAMRIVIIAQSKQLRARAEIVGAGKTCDQRVSAYLSVLQNLVVARPLALAGQPIARDGEPSATRSHPSGWSDAGKRSTSLQ